jgi:hypothetical protein
MARSPAHYLHALHVGVAQTPAMRMGALIHALVFKTERFTLWEGERRGKAWTEFRDAHPGDEIVSRPEMDQAELVAEAVQDDELAAPFLTGYVEVPVYWKIGNRECAGTPDVRTADFLCDLKTTTDASPARFPNFAMRSAYIAQLAWYLDGLAAAGLPVPGRIVIVAVEVKPPFAVCVYELTERAIEMGRRTWRLLFERLMACEAAGTFPGYAQTPVLLDAPEDLTLTLNGEELEL